MNEEITASCTWDVSSHLTSYEWANWHQRWRLPLLIVTAGATLLYLMWFIYSNDHITLQDVLPFLLIVAVSGFVAKRIFGHKAEYIRQLEMTPGYGQTAVWTINANGYKERLSSSHAFTAWTDVRESKETPDGVMIFISEGTFNWLPKTAFASGSDYDRFLHLIAAKTKHSKIG